MKKSKYLFIAGFLCLLLLPGLLWKGLERFAPARYAALSFGLDENRRKSEIRWNELADSCDSVSAWFEDRAPFRSLVIKGYQRVMSRLENFYDGRIYPLLVTGKDADFLAPRVVGNYTVLGRDNWLFYTGDDSIACYKGTNLLPEGTLASYAEKVNRLQEICGSKNVRLVLMFMPNKEQIYSRYMPSYAVSTEYRRIDRLTDYLREHTAVPVVYPKEALLAASAVRQTYYKYDTHWNYFGAYVGAAELLNALGQSCPDPFTAEGSVRTAVNRDLLNTAGLDKNAYPEDEDFEVLYLPEVAVLSEDEDENHVRRYVTDSPNPEHFVFIGDSFRLHMRGYLCKNFAQSAILDRNDIEGAREDILKADVLVVSAVERSDAKAFDCIDKLTEILSE